MRLRPLLINIYNKNRVDNKQTPFQMKDISSKSVIVSHLNHAFLPIVD